MKRRILVLPIAALLILSLCIYKLYFAPSRAVLHDGDRILQSPAPRFELTDERNQRVRLERYLGRHQVLLIFFNAETGATDDPNLKFLAEHHEKIDSGSIIVLGISDALPQQNRKAREKLDGFPGLLLTDPIGAVQRQWNAWNPKTKETVSRLFLIDRRGMVKWTASEGLPQSEENPRQFLELLLNNRSQ